jgi:hypothetical protein
LLLQLLLVLVLRLLLQLLLEAVLLCCRCLHGCQLDPCSVTSTAGAAQLLPARPAHTVALLLRLQGHMALSPLLQLLWSGQQQQGKEMVVAAVAGLLQAARVAVLLRAHTWQHWWTSGELLQLQTRGAPHSQALWPQVHRRQALSTRSRCSCRGSSIPAANCQQLCRRFRALLQPAPPAAVLLMVQGSLLRQAAAGLTVLLGWGHHSRPCPTGLSAVLQLGVQAAPGVGGHQHLAAALLLLLSA